MRSPRLKPACKDWKKGGSSQPHRARNPLGRLKELVERRKQWQDIINSLKGMRDWVLTTEHILSGAWANSHESLSNATVSQRFDQWCARLSHRSKLLAPLARRSSAVWHISCRLPPTCVRN
jgi:hypothetical protein